ncbi:Inositol oxygenase 1 [Vitis vinifera]|uniref:Inositol oxygenase n=1 Tax=Vitis vinifera TaxID=29760 RepID=A0A438K7J3_VITVI|nr:Inositol oxygenase 1 [Vitis vinifera]
MAATNSPRSILLTIFIFAMVLSPMVSSCDAARFTPTSFFKKTKDPYALLVFAAHLHLQTVAAHAVLLLQNQCHPETPALSPNHLGKVLFPSFGGLLQWAVVGDTFPGGCAFDESIVHHKYLKENPDDHNPAYNTKYGVYSEGCGLENVMMSWGHDDYMYLVAKEKKTTLPAAGLSVIIYHSLLCTSLLSSTGESWSSEVCRSSSTQLGLSLLEGQGMM